MTAAARTETIRLEDIPIAVALVDHDGIVEWANAAMVGLLGADPRSAAMVDLASPASGEHVHHVLDTGEVRTVVLRTAAGPDCVVDLFAVPAELEGGTVVFAQRSRVELEVLDELAKQANDLLGQGVIIGDARRLHHVSPTAAKIFGRSVDELLATKSVFGLFEESERDRITALVNARLAAGSPIPEYYETVVVRPDGSLLPVDVTIKFAVRGSMTRSFTIITDATERRASQRELVHRALHDHLTGLPNRYLLLERLEMTLRRLHREPREVSLLLIDLDRFKSVNDQYGHPAGDEVLRTIGHRLEHSLRTGDTAARIGGDEFVVLCAPSDGSEAGEALADRLRADLSQPVIGDGWSTSVGASIGIITFDDPSLSAEALLARVDKAMYADKSAEPS